MISPDNVSAVLVTRGDQDLQEIYDSIEAAGITDILTWDNSKRGTDLSCYGRYAAISEAQNEYVLFQDDDLIAPVGALLDAWSETDRYSILANNRIDEEWPLLGIGSIFHRDLVDGIFDTYIDLYGGGQDFNRICDVVFAYQRPYRRVVLGYRDLPWGTSPTASMYLQDGHMHYRMLARERTLALPQRIETARG